MLAAYTKVQNGQKVKEYLANKKALHPDFLPIKEFGRIYFPITRRVKVSEAKVFITGMKFPRKEKVITATEFLKEKLTAKQLALLPKAQEIVGDILILEIPPQLQKKERVVAEAYLKQHHNISTVVKKEKIHSGIYRTRTVKVLAGKRKKETVHSENGVKVKVHLEKMYFSSRLANERLRIAKLVKKGEEVLVMFSGIAPYPLVIAKNSPAKKIYAVEINPLAHQAALENVALNKLGDKINVYEGDVFHLLPKIRRKFDRIVMPLPKTGEDFLGLALGKSKPLTMIHFYSFLKEGEINKEAVKIRKLCRQWGREVRVSRKVKCGQFSPGTFRVCFDLKVIKISA